MLFDLTFQIKCKYYITDMCTNELINVQIILTKFFAKKNYLGMKWTDGKGGLHLL